jgi:hypothetical protein
MLPVKMYDKSIKEVQNLNGGKTQKHPLHSICIFTVDKNTAFTVCVSLNWPKSKAQLFV